MFVKISGETAVYDLKDGSLGKEPIGYIEYASHKWNVYSAEALLNRIEERCLLSDNPVIVFQLAFLGPVKPLEGRNE